MSSWAAPRAAFAQQLMGFGLGQLAQMEENKENDRRFQMAEKAEKDRENARRQWEKEMLRYRQDLADKEVAQTFTDEEGRIIPVTQGEIRKGLARVPEAELRRQQAAQEQAAQDADLKRRKTESEIARNEATGRGSLMRGEAARMRAQQSKPTEQQPPMSTSELNNVRSQLLSSNNNDPKAAYERARVLYGPEAADQIFPGIGNPQRRGLMQGAMDAATGFMRRASGGSDIDELLSKYNN